MSLKFSSVFKPLFFLFFLSFTLLFCLPNLHADTNEVLDIVQGDVAIYKLKLPQSAKTVKGKLNKVLVPFNMIDNLNSYAIIGIDFETPVGAKVLDIDIEYSTGGVEKRQVAINVLPGTFKLQKLTLPKKMVSLSEKSLKRVKTEKKVVQSLWPKSQKHRLWDGDFILPVEGRIQGTFGRKRLMNGKLRKSHSGEDITASKGTPVKSMNSGIVVNTSHMYFNGKGVFVDHGMGLFSMYFHLSEIKVKVGDKLKKGDIVGLVGATGRVTGAHLHVGAKYNGLRISPISLTKLKIPQ